MQNTSRGTIEYKQPVSLKDSSIYPNVTLITNTYVREEDARFRYGANKDSSCAKCALKDVIMKVKLEIEEIENDDIYTLGELDLNELKQFLDNISSKRKSSRTASSGPTSEVAVASIALEEGRHHIPVQPGEDKLGVEGQRRSQRARNVIIFEHY
eukprot:Seg6211.1 transcript_id=Seg6211.1/GoldUCD/mRNA.D3Y31 product="hypothetical protein" protein_id=Seg6211.1/GoldUCD/D3Y31